MQALHVALNPLLKHPMFIGFLKNASAAGITVEMLLGIGKLCFLTSNTFHVSVSSVYLVFFGVFHPSCQLLLCIMSHCHPLILSLPTITALGFVVMLVYLLHTMMSVADTVALSATEFRSFQLIAVEQISPDTKKLKFALQVSGIL